MEKGLVEKRHAGVLRRRLNRRGKNCLGRQRIEGQDIGGKRVAQYMHHVAGGAAVNNPARLTGSAEAGPRRALHPARCRGDLVVAPQCSDASAVKPYAGSGGGRMDSNPVQAVKKKRSLKRLLNNVRTRSRKGEDEAPGLDGARNPPDKRHYTPYFFN